MSLVEFEEVDGVGPTGLPRWHCHVAVLYDCGVGWLTNVCYGVCVIQQEMVDGMVSMGVYITPGLVRQCEDGQHQDDKASPLSIAESTPGKVINNISEYDIKRSNLLLRHNAPPIQIFNNHFYAMLGTAMENGQVVLN